MTGIFISQKNKTKTKKKIYFKRHCAHWLDEFGTDNPLHTDTRYNDEIRDNDNSNVMKPSLMRLQLIRNYARTLH